MKKLIALVAAVGSAVVVIGPAWAANRIINISDSEKVQVFDEPGSYNWLAPNNLVGTVQLLVVGGGGAGGGIGAGGGGGGEVFYADAVSLTAGATYSISVGAGGTGVSKSSGNNGSDSSISGSDVSYVVIGGGGGAGGWSRAKGKDGGSGGGGGGNGNAEIDGGASTASIGMGNPGAKAGTTYYSPGGGGGAMEAGHMFNEEGKKGYGGAGYVCAITGEDKMYGYGGGAGAGLGALSGAENEWGKGCKVNNDADQTPGEPGTGGGGGGSSWQGADPGAAGGCGTVIIRYTIDTAKDDFSADIVRSIKVPTTVTFTAELGTELSEMTWDFGDGSDPVVTTDLSISHEYGAAGKYTVTMTHGQQTITKKNYIEIVSGTLFVDVRSKNPQPPYDTRETAATKVADAITYAENGFEVRIAPGEYELNDVFPNSGMPDWGGSGSWNSATIAMFFTNAITVVGEGASPNDVVIRSKRRRNYYKDLVVFMDNADAFLSNVTLEDGSTSNQGWGGSIWITTNGGTVSNCVVRNGYASIPIQAKTGGVYMNAGLITHTVFDGCTFDETKYNNMGNSRLASAAYLAGSARMENCLFTNCMSRVGTVVTVDGANASLVNCTIADCQIGFWTGNNNVTNEGYAVGCQNGTVKNVAVYNVKRVAYNDNPETYDCAFGPDLSKFTCCVKAEKGDFANYDKGDLVPSFSGALLNAGDDASVNENTDLAGNPRIVGVHVDIGCYEAKKPVGLMMFIR